MAPVFNTPEGGDPTQIFPRSLALKTRVPGLSYGIVCKILCLAISTQYRHVTDTRTHRHMTMAFTMQA